MTGWFVALLWFPLLGAGFGRLARIAFPRDPLARWANAWLTGLAANGIILFALGLIGVPLGIPALAVIGSLSVLLAIAVVVPREETRPRWPLVPSVLMFAPLAAILLNAAIVPVTDYDGRAFWVLKGKAIAHERAIDGPFFQGKTSRNLHSEYPLLVPLGEASVFILGGDLDDRHVRPLFALVAVTFLFAFRYRLAETCGPPRAAWIAAALAWMPQLVSIPDGSAISAYADVPFAAFFGMAAEGAARREGPRRDLPLWLAALVLTKSEGVAAAVAILLALVLARFLRRLPWSVLAAPAASAAAAAALLAIWRARIPLEFDESYAAMLPTLPQRLDRVPAATFELFRRGLSFDAWGFFWIVAIAATALALTGDRWRTALVAAFAALLQSAAYVVTYAISPWILADLAGSSANRLLLHLVG
ncbi:MAG: hypothetical protein LC732_09625, partial [Acidobacteria bacterium]|nr:hypothetical protein [Acidobacteriota bacterium]